MKTALQIFNLMTYSRRVARNSSWGRDCFGGLGSEPPAAGGWGLGAKPAGGKGVWGREPPELGDFYDFQQK